MFGFCVDKSPEVSKRFGAIYRYPIAEACVKSDDFGEFSMTKKTLNNYIRLSKCDWIPNEMFFTYISEFNWKAAAEGLMLKGGVAEIR